jgi:hypothetical protein
MPTYLVELYWPGMTSERLLEALERGRRVMEQMNDEATPQTAAAASTATRTPRTRPP